MNSIQSSNTVANSQHIRDHFSSLTNDNDDIDFKLKLRNVNTVAILRRLYTSEKRAVPVFSKDMSDLPLVMSFPESIQALAYSSRHLTGEHDSVRQFIRSKIKSMDKLGLLSYCEGSTSAQPIVMITPAGRIVFECYGLVLERDISDTDFTLIRAQEYYNILEKNIITYVGFDHMHEHCHASKYLYCGSVLNDLSQLNKTTKVDRRIRTARRFIDSFKIHLN